jgi:hypothetical protein
MKMIKEFIEALVVLPLYIAIWVIAFATAMFISFAAITLLAKILFNIVS